jgi:hypothetical protein
LAVSTAGVINWIFLEKKIPVIKDNATKNLAMPAAR